LFENDNANTLDLVRKPFFDFKTIGPKHFLLIPPALPVPIATFLSKRKKKELVFLLKLFIGHAMRSLSFGWLVMLLS
jgi:hypothetical protein